MFRLLKRHEDQRFYYRGKRSGAVLRLHAGHNLADYLITHYIKHDSNVSYHVECKLYGMEAHYTFTWR